MRKLTWLFIILTLLAWLAIALYWTGTGTAKLQLPATSSTIIINDSPSATSSGIY